MFGRARKFLKDILFPIFCCECGQEGKWWCSACLANVQMTELVCPACERATQRGDVCSVCKSGEHSLDRLTAFFYYPESPAAASLIRQFKYNFARDILGTWQEVIRRPDCKIRLGDFNYVTSTPRLSRWPIGIPTRRREAIRWVGVGETAIIPVPLFGRRARARGFNQAELIAKIISAEINLPLNTQNLVRVRATAQQAKLTRVERQKNMSGAFAWRGAAGPPSQILLVDDVFTTGATMQECARALKAAGATWVGGVVIARD